MESLTELSADQVRSARATAPVFVLGCPRSGTTLLYHMLLSAGGFAVYRSESNVYNLLTPRFGNIKASGNRHELVEHWLRSKFFRASGLDATELRSLITGNCRAPGDFLRVTMQAVAKKQGLPRWAECTPDHLLYIREIKRQIPDALIVHIIRDGRDVALSFARQGWSHPLPWDRDRRLGVAALYWSWVVAMGRKHGKELGPDYLEVRYEELVADPRALLSNVSRFIQQDLDYDEIQRVAIGSVSAPNTSFSDAEGNFNPVGRWKTQLSTSDVQMLESLIGERLSELEYPLSPNAGRLGSRAHYMRAIYPVLFSAKLWLKNHTVLGRLTNTGPMELSS